MRFECMRVWVWVKGRNQELGVTAQKHPPCKGAGDMGRGTGRSLGTWMGFGMGSDVACEHWVYFHDYIERVDKGRASWVPLPADNAVG